MRCGISWLVRTKSQRYFKDRCYLGAGNTLETNSSEQSRNGYTVEEYWPTEFPNLCLCKSKIRVYLVQTISMRYVNQLSRFLGFVYRISQHQSGDSTTKTTSVRDTKETSGSWLDRISIIRVVILFSSYSVLRIQNLHSSHFVI